MREAQGNQGRIGFIVQISTSISFRKPIRSRANFRGKSVALTRETAEHHNAARIAVQCALNAAGVESMAMPIEVRIQRVSPRKIKDGDNLGTALKSIRDGIAEALGFNDGDPRFRWLYSSALGKPGVRITVINDPEVIATFEARQALAKIQAHLSALYLRFENHPKAAATIHRSELDPIWNLTFVGR